MIVLSKHRYSVYTGKNNLSYQNNDYANCKGSINKNRLHCTSTLSNNLKKVAFKSYLEYYQDLEFDVERINYFIAEGYISICDFYVLRQTDESTEHILYIEENRFKKLLDEICISEYDIIKIPMEFIYIEKIMSYNKFQVLNRPGEYISDLDLNFDIRSILINNSKFCYYDNTVNVQTPPAKKRRTDPPKLERKRKNYPYW